MVCAVTQPRGRSYQWVEYSKGCSRVSDVFASSTQHGISQWLRDPETSFLLKSLQQGCHGRYEVALPGLDQDAKQPHGGQLQRGGNGPSLSLVHEHQIRAQFQRQRERCDFPCMKNRRMRPGMMHTLRVGTLYKTWEHQSQKTPVRSCEPLKFCLHLKRGIYDPE